MVLSKLQGGCCAYCEVRFSTEEDADNADDDFEWVEATFDHVVPKSQGGSNDITNGLAVCIRCNTAKDDRPPTPQQLAKLAQIAPLAAVEWERVLASLEVLDSLTRGYQPPLSYRPAAADYVQAEQVALTKPGKPDSKGVDP